MSTQPAPIALPDRDVVFVSHANPEDNDFATWLTLRLIREGYRVWCDVVRLRGGVDFWKDIEAAIRHRTRKFVFVTSRASNNKQGVLQELAVAAGVGRQLKDAGFIIPVKIDDLPHAEHNIQINRLNAIGFNSGWADGLAVLLKTLDDESVPRPDSAGAASVASWWNAHRLNSSLVKSTPETLWTNWFPIRGIPPRLWTWTLPEGGVLPSKMPYPAYRIGNRLFSFATARMLTSNDHAPAGGTGFSFEFQVNYDPPEETGLSRHEVQIAVKQLIRQGWETAVERRGLPFFELSSRKRTLWFPHGSAQGGTVAYCGVDGKTQRRDLHGYKTITKLNGDTHQRFWHYGLEAVPVLYPTPVMAMKYHVVFTLDGKTITGDAKVQHRARRGQCKLWWNDKWRDMMLAAMTMLCGDNPKVSVQVAEDKEIEVESRPVTYQASVSYDDKNIQEVSYDETCDEFDAEVAEETEFEEAEQPVAVADSN